MLSSSLAQNLIIRPSGPGGGAMNVKGPLVGIEKLSDLVQLIINFLVPLAGVILFLIIIWGGYDVIASEGNPEKVQSGKQKITAGVIGFVLLVCSYFIAKLLGYIFGVGDGIL